MGYGWGGGTTRPFCGVCGLFILRVWRCCVMCVLVMVVIGRGRVNPTDWGLLVNYRHNRGGGGSLMHVGRRVSRMQATRGRHGPALLVPVSAVAVTVRDGVGECVTPCLRLFVLPAGTRVHRMGRRAWCGLQCCGGGHGRVRALLVMAWGGRGWLVAARALGVECREAGPGEVGWAGDAMQGVNW